jgi:transcriptional regulator with XRE-family HTH domain
MHLVKEPVTYPLTTEKESDMPEPLWKIRKRKGMSVNQLAAKSGVPALSIREYESGQAIRSADLPKLAKALYVEEWDIELKGTPLPQPKRTSTPTPVSKASPPPATRPAPEPESAAPPSAKSRPAPAPARPSQIEHLLTLASSQFGKDRAELEQEIGKPLEAMNRREVSNLLGHYQRILAESRPDVVPGEARSRRKRAYLPEGVDAFELHYLTAQQEANALLYFTLFDGQTRSGRIIGFSPYSITIQDGETGDEVTIQKLAIAYYSTEAAAGR